MAARAMPTHNGPPQKTNASTGAPNQALYITNLPEKIQKQDLRLSLYTLFSTYGPVLDVVALKTSKMRGQAHVVYRDVQASTQAMRALQGFDFFGKEMVSLHGQFMPNLALIEMMLLQKIQYAKGRSNVFTKLEGVYRPPTIAAPAVGATELQQSIFNAPPSSAASAVVPVTTSSAALLPKAAETTTNGTKDDSDGPQGVKRRREDESDEEDAPMEEDDDDVSMEASSEEE
ncbi:U2 snRNP complex subunit msl1 [Xylographa bjoerkii]|nr:U2 snRNP complex subunit msl1 [Xylographa bjoerkii]